MAVGHCFHRFISDGFVVNCTVFTNGWVLLGTTLDVMTGLITTSCRTTLCFWWFHLDIFLNCLCLCKLFKNGHQTRLGYCIEACYCLGHSHGRPVFVLVHFDPALDLWQLNWDSLSHSDLFLHLKCDICYSLFSHQIISNNCIYRHHGVKLWWISSCLLNLFIK